VPATQTRASTQTRRIDRLFTQAESLLPGVPTGRNSFPKVVQTRPSTARTSIPAKVTKGDPSYSLYLARQAKGPANNGRPASNRGATNANLKRPPREDQHRRECRKRHQTAGQNQKHEACFRCRKQHEKVIQHVRPAVSIYTAILIRYHDAVQIPGRLHGMRVL